MSLWTNLTMPQALVICVLIVCFLRLEVGVAFKQRPWRLDE